MKTRSALAVQLRSWAEGSYPIEAGVELLIRQGRAIYAGAPWISEDAASGRTWIDVETLLDESGSWSGSERRLIAVAASLIAQSGVNLNDAISGLDRFDLMLVLAAIAHANGSHEHSDIAFDETGTARIVRRASLFAWPSEGDRAQQGL